MRNSGQSALGTIPNSWQLTRGKNVLRLLNRPVREDDGVITCFRDGEVTLRSNRRTEGFTVSLKEIGYQGIEPGDLVVHSMDGFAGSIGISDSRGKASPVLNVLDSNQDKRYLMYYLRALAYRDVYLALADGIRVRSCNLSWRKIGELPILVPRLDEQQRIADSLDAKCAEIDAAIDSAQTSIEELMSYRTAVLNQTIQTAPRDVRPVKLKYLLKESKKRSADGIGEPLSITIARGVVKSSELNVPNPTSTLVGAKVVHTGDLVFNKLKARFGVMYVSPYDGLISPEYAIYQAVDDSIVSLRFLEYLCHTSGMIDEFIIRTSGVAEGFRRLYTSDLFDITIALPELSEQEAVVAKLDNLYGAIADSSRAKQSIIDDLKAYKQSLIYEVVTGKRDV